MKRLILIASVIFIGGSLVVARPTTQPTTQPAAQPSSPITKILIIPFRQAGDTTSHGWVGPAIQEDLMSHVAGSPAMEAVALNYPLANGDKPEAVKAAKDVGASIVVLGSYQFSDNQLRVMGQAVNVASGRLLAMLQARGSVTGLFSIEAALAAELSAALPQPLSNLPPVAYGQAETAFAYSAPAPVTTAAPPAYHPYMTQPYAYPSATYAYPYAGYCGYRYPYAGYYGYGYPSGYYPSGPLYMGIGVPYFGYGDGWRSYNQHWYGGWGRR